MLPALPPTRPCELKAESRGQGAESVAGTEECACCGPEAPRAVDEKGACVGSGATTLSCPASSPLSPRALFRSAGNA